MVLTILAKWRRKPKAYSVKTMPLFIPSDQQNLEQQISDYLIRLMESTRGKAPAKQIQVPSVLELSDFFQCQVMEVINALYGLRKHYYDFEFVGLNQPVILKIPQTRNMAKSLLYEPAWADT